MLSLLLKTRFKMLISTFRGGKGAFRAILFLFIALMLAFSLASFSYGIYRYAQYDPDAGGMLLGNLVAISFHGLFVLLLYSGLSQAVFTIFFSQDLDLLLSLPIESRSIYVYKVLEATILNSRISFLFLIPSLIIMGLHFKASWPFYTAILPITFFMAAIPGALGIILASWLTGSVSKARLKGALTVVGGLLGVSIWALINQFSGHFSSNSAEFGTFAMKYSNFASSPIYAYLPSGWANMASMSAAKGDWGVFGVYAILLFACSIALSYLAFGITARHYAGGVTEEIAGAVVSTKIGFSPGGSPIIAHIKRDFILLTRESGIIMQSVMLLLFLLLFPFVTRQDQFPKAIALSLSPVGAVFAVIFGGQLGSRLIPLERLGFWQNLAVPRGRFLALGGKLILGLCLASILSGFVAAIHFFTGKAADPDSIFLVISFSWAGFAVGLPLGLLFADFHWDNPRRMLKTGGNFAYPLACMLVTAALYFMAFLDVRFLSSLISPALLVSIFAIGLLAISVVVSALILANMEWNPGV